MLDIDPSKISKLQSELSFYEGQYLGLAIAFRERGNIEGIQLAMESEFELNGEANLFNSSRIVLDFDMLQKGYQSGLWLAMGHAISPEPEGQGIPWNVRVQSWTTEGIRDGLRFATQNNFSLALLSEELAETESLLDNVEQRPSMKFGASPRIYEEGYRRGLRWAVLLLKE